MMECKQYFVKQNNHHEIMLKTLHHLFTKEALMDITLSCEGKTLKAHKLILSASSPLFENLILENPSQHPIFIFQETKYSDLKSIIEFIYKGEICVSCDQLFTFLKTAKALKIRGIDDEDNDTISSQITRKNMTEETFPEIVQSSYKRDYKNNSGDFQNSEHLVKHIESETPLLIKESFSLANSSCSPFPVSSSKNGFTNNSVIKTESEECASDCETVKNFEIDKKEKKFDQADSSMNLVSSKIHEKVSSLKRERLDDSIYTSKATKVSKSLKTPIDSTEIVDSENTVSVKSIINAPHNFASSTILKRFENQSEIKSTLNDEKVVSSIVSNNKYCDDITSNNSKHSLQETNHLISNDYPNNNIKQGNQSDKSKNNSDGFQCDICQKIFAEESSLNIHRRFHTEEKPFSCYICQRKFSWESKLNDHLKIHSEINVYECYICKERFNERGSLNKHMRFHIGEKLFACFLCSKRFSRKIQLNRHIRTHTREEPHLISEEKNSDKDLNSNISKYHGEIVML